MVPSSSSAYRKQQSLLPICIPLSITLLIGFSIGVWYGANHSQNHQKLSSIVDPYIPNQNLLKEVAIPMDEFPEPAWRPPSLIAYKTVASTPFARFEIHKVKTESGVIVEDWLWTDERTHVNILVHLKASNKYLLFHQKKYGLDSPKYAVVGGLFNPGETDPVKCAHRELLEEAGLVAEAMISTGSYRVQVNRGGGILHTFFAKNCSIANESIQKDFEKDYEKQEVRLLTSEELIKVTLAGEVGEAQWVAAVALGLLYEEHAEHH